VPRLKTNGVELHWERAGAGDPVLLVHGLLYSGESWARQVERLASDFTVYTVDLRGQGRSETTPEQAGYDLWNQAEDVYGLIQGLGIAGCHYAGLSMGGMIGMRMLLRHPGTVRSLALVDTSADPEPEAGRDITEAFATTLESGFLEQIVPSMPAIWYGDEFVAAHPEVVDAWADRWRAADQRGLALACRGVCRRDDISDQVSALRLPTMVIHGTADVPVEPHHAERLASLIPGAELRWIEGAGHMSCIDHPEEVGALLSEHFSRVAAMSPT
jgi:pimeloyl-ACP methyl ester carboxylesterase